MKRLIAAIAIAACLPAGLGNAVTTSDLDDVGGPLDIRHVSFDNVGGDSAPVRLKFGITTYGRWSVKRCLRAAEMEDGCTIAITLDTKGRAASRKTGRGVDYRLVWGLQVCRLLDEGSHLVGQGISKKNGSTVSCAIRRSKLDIRRKIRWYVHTTWASPQTGRYSTDYAPDAGWYG